MYPMEKGSRSENKKTMVRLSVHIDDKGLKRHRLVVTVQSYAKVSSILSVVSDPRSIWAYATHVSNEMECPGVADTT